MTEIQTGTTGAKRMRWRENGPDAVLARLMENYSTAGEGELVDRMIKETENNKPLLRAIIEYFVRNTMRAMEENKRKIDRPTPRSTSYAVTREVEAAVQDRFAEIAAELCALPMPNGKDLGDCTGKELDLMNKANERLRKIVPANMTVREAVEKKRISVEQLEALVSNYKPKN